MFTTSQTTLVPEMHNGARNRDNGEKRNDRFFVIVFFVKLLVIVKAYNTFFFVIGLVPFYGGLIINKSILNLDSWSGPENKMKTS